MNWKRARALDRKAFLHILRDRRRLVIDLALPLLTVLFVAAEARIFEIPLGESFPAMFGGAVLFLFSTPVAALLYRPYRTANSGASWIHPDCWTWRINPMYPVGSCFAPGAFSMEESRILFDAGGWFPRIFYGKR